MYRCRNAFIDATVYDFYIFDGVMCLIKNVNSGNRKRLIAQTAATRVAMFVQQTTENNLHMQYLQMFGNTILKIFV